MSCAGQVISVKGKREKRSMGMIYYGLWMYCFSRNTLNRWNCICKNLERLRNCRWMPPKQANQTLSLMMQSKFIAHVKERQRMNVFINKSINWLKGNYFNHPSDPFLALLSAEDLLPICLASSLVAVLQRKDKNHGIPCALAQFKNLEIIYMYISKTRSTLLLPVAPRAMSWYVSNFSSVLSWMFSNLPSSGTRWHRDPLHLITWTLYYVMKIINRLITRVRRRKYLTATGLFLSCCVWNQHLPKVTMKLDRAIICGAAH